MARTRRLLNCGKWAQSSARFVIGHEMGRAVVPSPAQPHSDVAVRLDVLHILRLLAELRHEPELVADLAAVDGPIARGGKPDAENRCRPTQAGPPGVRRGQPQRAKRQARDAVSGQRLPPQTAIGRRVGVRPGRLRASRGPVFHGSSGQRTRTPLPALLPLKRGPTGGAPAPAVGSLPPSAGRRRVSAARHRWTIARLAGCPVAAGSA